MRPCRVEGFCLFLPPCQGGVGGVGFQGGGRTRRSAPTDWYRRLMRFPSFRRKPESIFTPFAFRQGSRTSAENETPSFIHPHPQMDSGFRRNDEQNRTASSGTGRDLSLQVREPSLLTLTQKKTPACSAGASLYLFERRYLFFFFRNDLWHAPHCLPMSPTAFLMAAGPPL